MDSDNIALVKLNSQYLLMRFKLLWVRVVKWMLFSWIFLKILTVPHQRPLHKLIYFDINNDVFTCILAFLSGRKQRFLVNGAFLNWIDATLDVQQDSVLFLLFIIDPTHLCYRVT